MSWREKALCQEAEIDFVTADLSKGHLVLCNACEVAAPCLEYGLNIPHGKDNIAGIYAGTARGIGGQ